MPELTKTLANRYGASQDVLEDICDTLIVEQEYAELDAEQQQAFHKWAFANAEHYLDGTDVDWVGVLHDWYDAHGPA